MQNSSGSQSEMPLDLEYSSEEEILDKIVWNNPNKFNFPSESIDRPTHTIQTEQDRHDLLMKRCIMNCDTESITISPQKLKDENEVSLMTTLKTMRETCLMEEREKEREKLRKLLEREKQLQQSASSNVRVEDKENSEMVLDQPSESREAVSDIPVSNSVVAKGLRFTPREKKPLVHTLTPTHSQSPGKRPKLHDVSPLPNAVASLASRGTGPLTMPSLATSSDAIPTTLTTSTAKNGLPKIIKGPSLPAQFTPSLASGANSLRISSTAPSPTHSPTPIITNAISRPNHFTPSTLGMTDKVLINTNPLRKNSLPPLLRGNSNSNSQLPPNNNSNATILSTNPAPRIIQPPPLARTITPPHLTGIATTPTPNNNSTNINNNIPIRPTIKRTITPPPSVLSASQTTPRSSHGTQSALPSQAGLRPLPPLINRANSLASSQTATNSSLPSPQPTANQSSRLASHGSQRPSSGNADAFLQPILSPAKSKQQRRHVTIIEDDSMLTDEPAHEPVRRACSQPHEVIASQNQSVLALQSQVSDPLYRRLVLTEITEEPGYTVLKGLDQQQCAVVARVSRSWQKEGLMLAQGDIVNVIGRFDAEKPNEIVIDQERNFLVVHPDYMISCTTISEAYECPRKGFLKGYCKSLESTMALAVTMGTLVHTLTQQALLHKNFTTEYFHELMDQLIRSQLLNLYIANVSIEEMKEALEEVIPILQSLEHDFFLDTFSDLHGTDTGGTNKSNTAKLPTAQANPKLASATSAHARPSMQHVPLPGVVSARLSPLDVEERVWSLMYGLKGDVDVTVDAELAKRGQANSLIERRTVLPFEIKSGKPRTSHTAQVLLYELLLSDRYRHEVRAGLLFTLKDQKGWAGRLAYVPAHRSSIKSLLETRNKIASHYRRQQMPVMAQDLRMCRMCFENTACTILHAALESGTAQSSGIAELFEEMTAHLSVRDKRFLAKWDRLLALEEREYQAALLETWTMTGAQREKAGGCLLGMQAIPLPSQEGRARYYRLQRWPNAGHPDLNIAETQIETGTKVTLSIDQPNQSLFCVAFGLVHEVRRKYIVISLLNDKKLKVPSHRKGGPSSQRFTTVFSQASPPAPSQRDGEDSSEIASLVWRVDKDEVTTSLSKARSNLVRLLAPDKNPAETINITNNQGQATTIATSNTTKNASAANRNAKNSNEAANARSKSALSVPSGSEANQPSESIAAKWRRLLIDMEKPTFDTVPLPELDASMNPCQVEAVQKALSTKDYFLIGGFPGTGKTTSIAHIVTQYFLQGKSILITAYTHSAVDNICIKLNEMKERHAAMSYVRIPPAHGLLEKVHHEVLPHTLNVSQFDSTHALDAYLSQQRIWATTCSNATSHALFSRFHSFDYCIIDEASQLILPVCLGPILLSKAFILVGDHKQLPPLVRSAEAKEHGLAVSLMETLKAAHPDSLVNLSYQYRMNEDIMIFCNTTVYDHALKCGSTQVAEKELFVPYPSHGLSLLSHFAHRPDWMKEILLPSRRVVWLDTQQVPAIEVQLQNDQGLSGRNEIEAILVSTLVSGLLSCGIAQNAIGIITPFKAQIKTIRAQLAKRVRKLESLDVLTIDKFQGRDKDCIIISLVRSNDRKTVGDLLSEWQRINVAFTRAKTKMIIIGDCNTLDAMPMLKTCIDICKERKWHYALPLEAHRFYFEDNSQQQTQMSAPLATQHNVEIEMANG